MRSSNGRNSQLPDTDMRRIALYVCGPFATQKKENKSATTELATVNF